LTELHLHGVNLHWTWPIWLQRSLRNQDAVEAEPNY